MTISPLWILSLALLPATLLPAISDVRAHTAVPPVDAVSAAHKDHERERGEQVFAQNCSRCHQPPMSISPRITGTVLAHMRVRARLSRQEQSELLRFMTP